MARSRLRRMANPARSPLTIPTRMGERSAARPFTTKCKTEVAAISQTSEQIPGTWEDLGVAPRRIVVTQAIPVAGFAPLQTAKINCAELGVVVQRLGEVAPVHNERVYR